MPRKKKASEEPEVLTGEEVSLDAQADVTDSDLVGAVDDAAPELDDTQVSAAVDAINAAFENADVQDTSVETVVEDNAADTVVEEREEIVPDIEETVSLPVGSHSAPVEGDDSLPIDVLHGRSESEISFESEPEEPQFVTRRSLITPEADETVEQTEYLITPAAAPPTFDQATSADASMLADATVLPTLPSKAGARWMSAILTLLLTPVAWYLLSDAGARLAFATGNPWESGVINPAALIELGVGFAVVALIALIAAQSSIGLAISGLLVFALGLVFLFAPQFTAGLIEDNLTGLRNLNAFGSNVVGCLELTGFSGVLALTGFFMFAMFLVIRSVRRAGRREEAMRELVAATNPAGLKARWARKATNSK